jgi:hypothetical protein
LGGAWSERAPWPWPGESKQSDSLNLNCAITNQLNEWAVGKRLPQAVPPARKGDALNISLAEGRYDIFAASCNVIARQKENNFFFIF